MKLTPYEQGNKRPSDNFGSRKGWKGYITRASVAADKCLAAGLSTRALYNWRRRNPGSPLSDEDVIKIILENKAKGCGDHNTPRAIKCRAAGIRPGTVSVWRNRHPGSPLSDEDVIKIILENKKRLGRY